MVLTQWFTRDWWSYLFGGLGEITSSRIEFEVGPLYVYRELPWPRLFGCESVSERAWCRMRGHPHGMVFYNPGGMEPDDRCRDCGERLG